MKKGLVFVVLSVMLLLAVFAFSDETLRVLVPIGGGYTIEDQEAVAKEFERDNPGVNVEMEYVGWDQLWNKIVTSVGVGSAPDVMYIGSRWIPALAEMGAIEPIDDLVTQEKYEMYWETVWDTVRYNEHIYGIVRAMSTKVFIYNKDLFEKHNLEVPKNWDELLEAAKTIHDPENGVYGIAMAGQKFISTVTQFQHYLYANGGRIIDEEGNVVINDPKAIRALDFYKELSSYAQPAIIEWRREDLIKLFETGKVGFYLDHVHNALAAMEKGVDVGLFKFPGGPDSDLPYSTVIVTDSMAISAQSKNKELAAKFINYMTTIEKQTEWDITLGFVPPMKKEAESPEFQTWYWKPYIEVIQYGYPEAVGIKDWEAVQQVILDAIHSVLLGASDPKQALDNAARIITILQQ